MLCVAAVTSFVAFVPGIAHAKDLPVAPLYQPEPIQIPAGTTVEQVKKGVRKGLYLKDWLIRDIGPDQLHGQFNKGDKYTISVELKYDAKIVGISYKDSAGLNYGGGLIHKTYNERIRDLEKAIRAELDAF